MGDIREVVGGIVLYNDNREILGDIYLTTRGKGAILALTFSLNKKDIEGICSEGSIWKYLKQYFDHVIVNSASGYNYSYDSSSQKWRWSIVFKSSDIDTIQKQAETITNDNDKVKLRGYDSRLDTLTKGFGLVSINSNIKDIYKKKIIDKL